MNRKILALILALVAVAAAIVLLVVLNDDAPEGKIPGSSSGEGTNETVPKAPGVEDSIFDDNSEETPEPVGTAAPDVTEEETNPVPENGSTIPDGPSDTNEGLQKPDGEGSEDTRPTHTEPAVTEPREPQQTEPKEPQQTESEEPQQTEPREPQQTEPKEPQQTEPREPQQTEPKEPQQTEPEEPQQTEPKEPQQTEPEEPAETKPSEVPEGEIDYETFLAMEPAQQRAYMESFESMEDFFIWYNAAKEAYELEHPSIDVGDGVIDLEDLFG